MSLRASNPMVVHYVRDMAGAVTFYRDVFAADVQFESSGWSTLDFGGLILALHGLGASSTEGPLPHAGLNLQVDDLDAMIERVVAAGGARHWLREPAPGVPVRLAGCADPDGNHFELREQVTR